MQQIDTVLFDLDGTLLPIDLDQFLQRYFALLTKEFSDLAEPDKLIKSLYQATEKMVKNNGERTNKEVFIECFFSLVEVDDREEVMKRFDRFYREKFPVLQEGIEINREAVALVELLKRNGMQLVIATNPLFPIQAIEERIKWAGLNADDFTYITSYEKMHYSKPNINYYREILKKVCRNTEQCIMIGNDVREDVVAKELGIKTYLVEEFKIERETDNLTPDWEGSINDLRNHFRKKLCS